MRITLLLFIIAILGGCSSNKKTVDIPENDWIQAKIAFNELTEVLEKENGETWDHSLKGPLLLVNRDTRTIIANDADNSGKLIQREDLFVGKLPEKINIANTAQDWNGKIWTMVALPLPLKKSERLSLLIHESFHRIQPEIGFKSLNEIQSNHLDTKDGRIYLTLELEALKEALDSEQPDAHIKNALLFRMYRYQIFPDAKNAENSLEINEGLAEYTGSILSQRKDSDLKEHYISQIDLFYTMPTYVRSFSYFTIPVYGYFMQKSHQNWNLEITNDTNLSDFINDSWKINSQKLSSKDIARIGAMYGIDAIIEKENLRELKKEALKNKYKSTFLSDSIVEIELENMKIGFNPSNIVPLDPYGTVYPNLRVTDNWGILKVDSCGALMSSDWKKVTISYPVTLSDSLIVGKGWSLKLDKLYKLELKGYKYIIARK